ncbi:hypothetical protein N780_08705 [Pontibacillus chungwhensis BH030062]|uniref:Uncharacterized protein n=1 Tax=Pontibacillus chungwhensis BH030062 TaxID=1385513 RepID=A0A0A2UWZ7_9BACI|nr:hypothetical protein [Pontibacillus chungwhensis]KGP91268.1 hypothetical protein N780_08705 [Pontibacillus chungwhensis BH030062]
MSKNIQSISVIFLGVCILLGSWFISQSFESDNKVSPVSEEQYRYEFISANEQNIIIFDKKTGNYWRKFVEPNEGPTEWEKQESPVMTSE